MSRRALAGAALLGLLSACRRDASSDAAARKPAPDALDALLDAHKANVVTAAALTRPAAPKSPTTLRVLVAGDLIPHRPSLATAASVGSALAPLGPLFGGANAVVANYEAATTVSNELPTRKMAYAAPRDWLGELRRSGVTAVTVANNHACDLDVAGVETTLEASKAAGIAAIGGDEEDPWTPRVLAEAGGRRVCAVGWTTLMNAEGACGRNRRLAVATTARRSRIDAAIARARASCDATVAIVHGGLEYAAQTDAMLDLARHVAEIGADAVIVHHPHVSAPVELHVTRDGRRVPLFASVGNLVSNQGESWTPEMFPVLPENRRLVCVNAWTRLGMIADLAFTFDDEAHRTEWGYHLVWTDNEHARDRGIAVPKIAARLLDPERDRALVSKLEEDAKGPGSVFEDPCWLESPGPEQARAHRCSLSSPPVAAPPQKASGRALEKAAVARARRHR